MKEFLQVFTQRRMALMLVMGFSSGLPIALAISTLQAWIASEGMDIKTVGAFTLVQLPYQFKFLWSPIIDRITLPFLGRRRGWMLLTQLGLMVSIAALGFCDPHSNIELLAGMAVVLAFVSASQDVVVDAYRADTLATHELGSGSALSILGYRLGMITSGSVALILAESLPWRSVYLIMAALMSIGVVATLLADEPTQGRAPRSWREAIVDPFLEFVRRAHVFELLLFVLLYKFADVMALALSTKFLLELGFSKGDIGVVSKGFGLVATILGAIVGASLMSRLSLVRSLLLFGIFQALAVIGFGVLAIIGKNYSALAGAVFIENFTSGMGTAAFAAFLTSLCQRQFSATQYALLSALSSMPRAMVGPVAATLVSQFGWTSFFFLCAACALPGLILLSRFRHWSFPDRES